MYDPQIRRWHAPDPFGEKYNALTPYNYCSNNPINSIDFDGRDIIVLNAPKAVGELGHAAVLIGNDKNGWYLYSKNGTYGSSGIEEKFSGPSDKGPDVGTPFRTLKDFANSEKNFNMQENGDVQYTGAFRIQSDVETDKKMALAAIQRIYDYYNVAFNSCIDVPIDALKAGGFNTAQRTDFLGLIFNRIPNARYYLITQQNVGTDVTKSITPSEKTKEEMRHNSDNVLNAEAEAGQKMAEQNAPQNTLEEFE